MNLSFNKAAVGASALAIGIGLTVTVPAEARSPLGEARLVCVHTTTVSPRGGSAGRHLRRARTTQRIVASVDGRCPRGTTQYARVGIDVGARDAEVNRGPTIGDGD